MLNVDPVWGIEPLPSEIKMRNVLAEFSASLCSLAGNTGCCITLVSGYVRLVYRNLTTSQTRVINILYFNRK